MWNIANDDNTWAGIFAYNLLLYNGVTSYNEPIILPDLNKSRLANYEYEYLINITDPSYLKIHPNPAMGYIIVEYSLENHENAEIAINDLGGNSIITEKLLSRSNQIVIITDSWTAGVYIVALRMNGKNIESVKFTVTN